MGYTHYWKKVGSIDESLIAEACAQMRDVIAKCGDLLDGPHVGHDFVIFDGSVDSCETFAFPGEDRYFEFCKTRRYPYDVAVTACLAIAADVLGKRIDVTSDGERDDWSAGCELASLVLGRDIANPIDRDGNTP